MKRWRVELVLLLVVIAIASIAEGRWRHASVQLRSGPSIASGGAMRMHRVDSDSLAAAADGLVARNPFRLGALSSTRAVPVAASASPPPLGPRPMLSLKAIVGGPPWQAIVTGIPGQSGETLVTVGARFESLSVFSISRDTLVLQGADTTWKLTLHRSTP